MKQTISFKSYHAPGTMLTLLAIILSALSCTKQNSSDNSCTMTADTLTSKYTGAVLYTVSSQGSGNTVSTVAYNTNGGPQVDNNITLAWSKEVQIDSGKLIGIVATGKVKEASITESYFYSFNTSGGPAAIQVSQLCGSGNLGHTLPYYLSLTALGADSSLDGYFEYIAGFTDSSTTLSGVVEQLGITYSIANGSGGFQNSSPNIFPFYVKVPISAGTAPVIRATGYFKEIGKFFVMFRYYDQSGTLLRTGIAHY